MLKRRSKILYLVAGSVGAGRVTVSRCVAVTTVVVSATLVSAIELVGVYFIVAMLYREVRLAVALKLLTHADILLPQSQSLLPALWPRMQLDPSQSGFVFVRSRLYEPIVVLVGTERHLRAEEIAAETVYAAGHAGLDPVAALLLTGVGGGIHCTVEVTVEAAGRVDVTVEVVTRRV
jgi:hypothetical protein